MAPDRTIPHTAITSIASAVITDLGSLRDADDGPVRFLHSSDLHLGKSGDSPKAFQNLVKLALERNVDLVVLGGDVYDSAERSAFAQLQFTQGLTQLTQGGIRVFIAHGNHDPVQASFTPAAPLPEGVYTFTEGEPQTFVMTIGATRLAVTGVSFATQKEEANLVEKIGATSVDADLRIAVVHANVEGLPGHDNYAGCSRDDLLNSDIHYWALGHIHDRTVTPMPAGRWWAYPGNLQGRSTKATECGPKGVLIVEAAGTGFAEPEFVACDLSRFLRVQADVTGAENLSSAVDQICLQARSAIEQDNPLGLPTVVRIAVSGATPAHPHLQQLLKREDEFTETLSAGLPANSSIKSVSLDTTAPYDRDRLAARQDVVGAVLTKLDELRSTATSSQPNSQPNPVMSALLERAASTIGLPSKKLTEQALVLNTITPEEFFDQVERLLLDGLAPSNEDEGDVAEGTVQE
jgi:DNA repair exonuclease SbcCD nuclease subunit